MRRARQPVQTGEKGVFPSHPAKGEEGRRRLSAAAAVLAETGANKQPRIISRALQAQRELFIEELVIVNTAVARIIELARRPVGPVYPRIDPSTGTTHQMAGRLIADGGLPGIGCGAVTTRKLIGTVIEKLQAHSEQNRPNNKATAEARLFRHLRDARSRAVRDGKWTPVIAAERLLSDIQGTRAPIKVDVSVTLQTALMNVLGNMGQEQMDGLLAEYDELEAKAKDGSSVYVQTPKAKPAGHIYEVHGSAGVEYMVMVTDAGVATCTCPDFQFRGAERPCKHVLLIKGELPQTGLRRGAP